MPEDRLLTPEERKPFETAHGAFGVPMMYDIFGLLEAQLAKTDAEWEAKIKAERERIIKEIENKMSPTSNCSLEIMYDGHYAISYSSLQSLKQQIREGLK